jgi:hypothetical protein
VKIEHLRKRNGEIADLSQYAGFFIDREEDLYVRTPAGTITGFFSEEDSEDCVCSWELSGIRCFAPYYAVDVTITVEN